eukprot:m.208892 g.208892  ORF g.208892 m.208892 type:complete len:538 (+) comp22085_c0_seq5:133-1746(+)
MSTNITTADMRREAEQQPLVRSGSQTGLSYSSYGSQNPTSRQLQSSLHEARQRAHRTLAFFCVFDFLFIMLLWALVSQGFHGAFSNVSDSISRYQYQDSLFDVVCLALVRALFLIVCYWYMRWTSPWCVMITTGSSTAFLLVKVFYYGFTDTSRPTDYVVFIAAFVIPWCEAWIYMSRISPLDKQIALLYAHELKPENLFTAMHVDMLSHAMHSPPSYPASSSSSHQHGQARAALASDPYVRQGLGQHFSYPDTVRGARNLGSLGDDDDTFTTPRASPTPSTRDEMDSEEPGSPVARGPRILATPTPAQCAMLMREGNDAVQTLLACALDKQIPWAPETEQRGVTICSIMVDKRKVYRSEGFLHIKPRDLFEMLLELSETDETWFGTWECCRSLSLLDSCSDLMFMESTSLAMGFVEPREFVCVRKWATQNNCFAIAWTSVQLSNVAGSDGHTSGTFYPGGFVCAQVEGQPHVTRLMWVFNVDYNLSRWTPALIVHQNIISSMVNFYERARETGDTAATTTTPGGGSGTPRDNDSWI